MRTFRIINVALLLACHQLACAGFDEGVAAYDRGDYAVAIQQWRPIAEKGHADAQFNLGVMYDAGRGAQQDPTEAEKWYRKAAEQGVAEAQYNLGVMYDEGMGVQQDTKQAVKWFEKAAEQGFPLAQMSLALMYYEGRGVNQDYVQAYMWFDIAGAGGVETSTRNRDIVAGKMNPAQIAKARKLAREWMEQHQTE